MSSEQTTNDNINEETKKQEEESKAKTAPDEKEDAQQAKSEPKKEQKHERKLERELEEAKKQISETNDKYLRILAEYDNYRKRSTKEKSDSYSDAYSDAVKAFLPLADSLCQALGFEPDDEGIKALDKQFSDILSKLGIKEIESDGKEFDPHLHNAIMHEEDAEKGENIIVQTFQKGYMLGEKVIRHAIVKVVN